MLVLCFMYTIRLIIRMMHQHIISVKTTKRESKSIAIDSMANIPYPIPYAF